jgi:hypothetical protein
VQASAAAIESLLNDSDDEDEGEEEVLEEGQL